MDILKDKTNKGLYFGVFQVAFRSQVLTLEERSVFFAIRSYAPIGQFEGTAFPSTEKIAAAALVCEKTARNCIKSLIKKGFITKKRRGLGQTNLYTINDCPELWDDHRTDEERENITKNDAALLSTEDMLAELARRGVYIQTSTPTSAENSALEGPQEPTEEKAEEIPTETTETLIKPYNEADIFDPADYWDVESMKEYAPKLETHIDAAMDLIEDIENTTGNTQIELKQGEYKPLSVVKSVLAKLTEVQIIAAIQRTLETPNIRYYKKLLLCNLYGASIANAAQLVDLQGKIRSKRTNPKEAGVGSTIPFNNFPQRDHNWEIEEEEAGREIFDKFREYLKNGDTEV